MGYHIFVDFDGTITKTDTLQYILDTFGDKDWRKIEEAVSRGEIDEIDGLRLEFATVRASKEVRRRCLLRSIRRSPSTKVSLPFGNGVEKEKYP